MSKVFIGGSRRITKLNGDIANRIDNIMQNGYLILFGDANGVDRSVQKYLQEKQYRNALVYCTGAHCRNNLAAWETKHIPAGRKSKRDFSYYTLKDAEMAKEADYGFMIWDGTSKGTLNNILNLLKENKKTLLYFYPRKEFWTVDTPDALKKLLAKCDQHLQAMFKKSFDASNNKTTDEQRESQTALSFR